MRALRGPQLQPAVLREPLELAVEGGEPLLGDLAGVRAPDLELVARPELLRRDLLRPPAHAAGDVASIEPQLLAVAVDAADDDVRMRVARVVVVDRRPLDLAPEVLLDLAHEAPHVGGEVQLARILGRHDEPKLVLLAKARLFERPPPHRSLGPVERALGAVLLDAVALDVPQVQRGGLGAVAVSRTTRALTTTRRASGRWASARSGPADAAPPRAAASATRASTSLRNDPARASDSPSRPLPDAGPKYRQIVGRDPK